MTQNAWKNSGLQLIKQRQCGNRDDNGSAVSAELTGWASPIFGFWLRRRSWRSRAAPRQQAPNDRHVEKDAAIVRTFSPPRRPTAPS